MAPNDYSCDHDVTLKDLARRIRSSLTEESKLLDDFFGDKLASVDIVRVKRIKDSRFLHCVTCSMFLTFIRP